MTQCGRGVPLIELPAGRAPVSCSNAVATDAIIAQELDRLRVQRAPNASVVQTGVGVTTSMTVGLVPAFHDISVGVYPKGCDAVEIPAELRVGFVDQARRRAEIVAKRIRWSAAGRGHRRG